MKILIITIICAFFASPCWAFDPNREDLKRAITESLETKIQLETYFDKQRIEREVKEDHQARLSHQMEEKNEALREVPVYGTIEEQRLRNKLQSETNELRALHYETPVLEEESPYEVKKNTAQLGFDTHRLNLILLAKQTSDQ